MKNGIFGAILVAIFAVGAAQAEDGRMSASKLDSLGLSSMKLASDSDGMQVRGHGRMFVSGIKVAYAGPSSANNTYGATAIGPNVLGFGQAQVVADWTVLTNLNFFLSHTATAYGRAIAFAP